MGNEKVEARRWYWPIDVMGACCSALDQGSLASDEHAEALAVYAVASAAREADRKIPVPGWLEDFIVETA